jgi:hypothetical protein
VYYGSGTSWNYAALPNSTDDRPLVIPTVLGTNHGIGLDDDYFLIGCGQATGFAPSVLKTQDFSNYTKYPFWISGANYFVNCCEAGFVAESPEVGGDIWQDYNRYNLIADTDIDSHFGMSVRGSTYLYLGGSGNSDLYRSNVLLAAAATVFDSLSDGGRAVFFPTDSEQIVWVTRTNTGSGNIVVYSSDAGETWSGKNGDLLTVLGSNWAGESSPSRGNAVVYVVEI